MEIHISIESREPLAGTATAGGSERLHFDGWLEMLRAISLLLEACDRPEMKRPDESQCLSGVDPDHLQEQSR